MVDVVTGSPFPVTPVKSSSNCAGVSVLSKLKPVSESPAPRSSAGVAVHSMPALPAVAGLIVSVQPVGEVISVGTAEWNPVPGIQENQKVPMAVVPVLSRVME